VKRSPVSTFAVLNTCTNQAPRRYLRICQRSRWSDSDGWVRFAANICGFQTASFTGQMALYHHNGRVFVSPVMYKLKCYVLFTRNSCLRSLRICFKPTVNIIEIYSVTLYTCRSQWPRCQRYRSAAARLLELLVRIPPGAWMSVCCVCCKVSGRVFCDGPIPRPEESYWVFVLLSVIRCNNNPTPEMSR
jgi:hypothetical protein